MGLVDPQWEGVTSRVVIERLQAGPSTERYSGSMSCSESLYEKMTQEYMKSDSGRSE